MASQLPQFSSISTDLGNTKTVLFDVLSLSLSSHIYCLVPPGCGFLISVRILLPSSLYSIRTRFTFIHIYRPPYYQSQG